MIDRQLPTLGGMGIRDERVDAYIAKSAEFARPILNHLRETVHAACPDVEETIKWSSPHFLYEGMLCMMAAFKGHCGFGFWKGSLITGKDQTADEQGRGQFGKITTLEELPSRDVLFGPDPEGHRTQRGRDQTRRLAPGPRRPRRSSSPTI